ncbi:MAG: DoxX family membrane protein [Ignavibacteriales bacterium]|nr:MAG: DoxX family membrane protein [Ignavibacteriales bacterium]
MQKLFSNKYLLLVLRLITGFVFIYAGLEKALEPSGFANSIVNYKLLPDFTINFIAITLPWIELAAGLLLIFGVSVKENSMIISTLLVLFIIMIAISLLRGLNIDCGCFGTAGGSRVGIIKIVENLILLAISGHLTKYDSEFLSLRN